MQVRIFAYKKLPFQRQLTSAYEKTLEMKALHKKENRPKYMRQNWKDRLVLLREANNNAAWAISEYIDNSPRAITSDLIREADPEGILPEEAMYAALMAGLCGIAPSSNDTQETGYAHNSHLDQDSEASETSTDSAAYTAKPDATKNDKPDATKDENNDGTDLNEYFRFSVRRLDSDTFTSNPYFENIHFPEITYKGWRLTHYTYAPYEAFICNDLITESSLMEIPPVGYFRKPYTYPAIEQEGREWMAVKPSEIASMQPHIDIAAGDIVTFGLGLGYYTFMAASKPEVRSVTIVERDRDVISLFEKILLPQFPCKEKITVVHEDAFNYMEREIVGNKRDFNYAFVDLWHDNSDGLELYLRSKKYEKEAKSNGNECKFSYWVEHFLLSALRWQLFDRIVGTCTSEAQALQMLSDQGLLALIDASSH